MFTINVERECGCFKRSEFNNNASFNSKDDALIQAKQMENHMNEKFCQKHGFITEETGDSFTIRVVEKPRATSGGCCGGGHCS
jgi:hypothetical protein